MIFRLQNLGKEFSGNWLFQGVTAQCNVGDRVGLIGRNGVGKTTLFDLIEGHISPDEGSLTLARNLSVSRISQIGRLDSSETVRQEALHVFDVLKAVEERLSELEHEISEGSNQTHSVAEEYEKLRVYFELQGGYDYSSRTEKVLFGLGFTRADLNRECAKLSGGQRRRLLLAKALLRPADLMLLDEPTNHLDLGGILWLSEFLQRSKNPFVAVSHDRYFLDSVTNKTWELEHGQLFDCPVSFSKSRELRAERIRRDQIDYERQQEWKRKTVDYIRKNIVGQKTKQAQSRRKRLEATVWLDKPVSEADTPKIQILEAQRGGALTVEIRDGVVGFEDQPLISGVDLTVYRGDRVGVLGGNGTGKTTLLRTILGHQRLLAGDCTWGANNIPVYFEQENSFGSEEGTVFNFLAELCPWNSDQEIRDYAARFLFRKEDVFKRVEQLSGGERSRLALARLFSHPFNTLLMDEPTNHLDIESREALESAICNFEGSLIVTSHDLYFLSKIVDRFILIKEGCLEPLERLDQLKERILLEDRVTGGRKRTRNDRPKRSEELSKNEKARLRNRISEIEASIERAESERTRIERLLTQNTDDHVALTEFAQRYGELELEIQLLFDEWEELSQTLELRG